MSYLVALHQNDYVCDYECMVIKQLRARMILDSRGNPTVEVDCTLEAGETGRASVPSGASTGSREAIELRDNDTAYGGLGVQRALKNITSVIAPAVIGKPFDSQNEFDAFLCELDGTENKSNLGANALLAVSLAFAKATANSRNQQLFKYMAGISNTAPNHLPTPMFNVINGGKHALNSADIQEFMIVPTGISSYEKQLQAGTEVFHTLGTLLAHKECATTVGDEGGYVLPPHHKNTDALELIVEAIEKAGYEPGKELSIALDVASSEIYDEGVYTLQSERLSLKSAELIAYYQQLLEHYPIISIEDGLDENDWSNWTTMNSDLGGDIMLVGDDLLVTNTTYIQQAVDEKVCNAVLIKPNQIGTLSETIDAVSLTHKNNMTTIMSHRSGETEDTTIAHLAVGLGTKFIKSGSLSRSERLAKYNELLRIQETL